MLFALVAATAVAVSASPIVERDVGGVLICTGANATGTCDYQVYPLKQCHQLKAPLYANVGTFAPDGEDFFCYPRLVDCGASCRSPTGCTFGAVNFTYEHKYDIAAIHWKDLFKSFDCFLYNDN